MAKKAQQWQDSGQCPCSGKEIQQQQTNKKTSVQQQQQTLPKLLLLFSVSPKQPKRVNKRGSGSEKNVWKKKKRRWLMFLCCCCCCYWLLTLLAPLHFTFGVPLEKSSSSDRVHCHDWMTVRRTGECQRWPSLRCAEQRWKEERKEWKRERGSR